MRRALVILAILAAVVAAPFLLRPPAGAPANGGDTLVIVTPHNGAIRHEFALGFAEWYRARTGRAVSVDWRMPGGTSDIARYLSGAYVASFRNYWTGTLGRSWSAEVQAGFQDGRLAGDATPDARQARDEFLKSRVGCGADLFFGGGAFDFGRQAEAGTLVDSGIREKHPEWFSSAILPQERGGEVTWDPRGRWYGCVLSCFGIIYNRDAVKRLGFAGPPEAWSDLADPRFFGEVALADPTKSGSVAEAFENLMQQRIRMRMKGLLPGAGGLPPGGGSRAATDLAVGEGWIDGLRLLQLIGANARYFTDSAQKVPIDVADGDCAAGMCIDFFGRQQDESLRRRDAPGRIGFSTPQGGSTYSVDPVGLLRGAPHPGVAAAFIEYVLSLDGQKLWNFRTGTPGGPRDYALRRLPVRRDFYLHPEWSRWRSDPSADPYHRDAALDYHPEWTGGLFRELSFIVRVMDEDTHDELARAWAAVNAAPQGVRPRALAELQDMSAVDYGNAGGRIRRALDSKDRADEVRLAAELAASFRRHYERAEAMARGE